VVESSGGGTAMTSWRRGGGHRLTVRRGAWSSSEPRGGGGWTELSPGLAGDREALGSGCSGWCGHPWPVAWLRNGHRMRRGRM
jgi:hypothetical protein